MIVAIALLFTQKLWVPKFVSIVLQRSATSTPLTQQQKDYKEYGIAVTKYGYRCGDGTEFSIVPNNDMSTLSVIPASSSDLVPLITIKKVDAQKGVRYEGNGIIFEGSGETVTLTLGKTVVTCSPVVSQTDAPLNFGD